MAGASSSATRGRRRHHCRGSGGDEELGKAAVGGKDLGLETEGTGGESGRARGSPRRGGFFPSRGALHPPRAARCGGLFSLPWYRALEAFVVTTTLGGFIC